MFESSKQPKSINFLEPVYSPTDIWANAYIWLVNVGKYLLIAVEVVVLGVFISRFVLDKKNNDLTDDINNKVELLSNDTWVQNSILFENYQILFSDVKKVSNGQEVSSTKISELISGVPSSLNVETFSYTENKVGLYITSTNIEAVKNYETALRNNPGYSDVRFTISKEDSNLDVRISFNLNGE